MLWNLMTVSTGPIYQDLSNQVKIFLQKVFWGRITQGRMGSPVAEPAVAPALLVAEVPLVEA